MLTDNFSVLISCRLLVSSSGDAMAMVIRLREYLVVHLEVRHERFEMGLAPYLVQHHLRRLWMNSNTIWIEGKAPMTQCVPL
jgi:hypothetical protein